MEANPLRPTYDCDVPRHLNQEVNHRIHIVAPVVTATPFSVFECLERCSKCSHGGRFRRIRTDGNTLQVRDPFGERRDTAVSGRSKSWDH